MSNLFKFSKDKSCFPSNNNKVAYEKAKLALYCSPRSAFETVDINRYIDI